MATPGEALSLRGVRDAYIYDLTSDTVAGLVYGTGYAVTMQEFSFAPDINSAELPGNDVTLDIVSQTKGHSGKIKNAKVHMSFLATLLGGQIGTTSTTREVKYAGSDVPGYFKFAIKTSYTGDGATTSLVHIRYKCKLSNLEFASTQDGYTTFSCDWKAIPTTWVDGEGDNPIGRDTHYSTNVSLS